MLGGYPVINPANLRAGRLVPDEECTVNDAATERLAHHRLRDGDILFARRGELGRCGLVTNQEQGWLCGTGCLRLRVRRDAVRPRFLIRLLSTSGVADWLGLQSVGATMQNLNTSIIGPRIDALVAKKERLIELLQEKRTALITRTVTGIARQQHALERPAREAGISIVPNCGQVPGLGTTRAAVHRHPVWHLVPVLVVDGEASALRCGGGRRPRRACARHAADRGMMRAPRGRAPGARGGRVERGTDRTWRS